MSLSPEVIDAMVANGATVEMLAAVMKAELAAIAKRQAEAEAQAAARRASAAEKKRRQRALGVPARPDMSPGRPSMSLDVPGTEGDEPGQTGTPLETKVSPTPPSKTQTPVTPPIVPPRGDGSLFADGEVGTIDQPVKFAAKRGSSAARMASDVEFAELWNIATLLMRRRAKSQAKTYPAWLSAKERQLPGLIVMALRRYVTEDEDVKRGMGQPGLQRWLADQAYDQWLATSEGMPGIADDRWRMMVEFYRDGTPWSDQHGPPPDAPGCRVPAVILAEFGFATNVVAFQGAAA